MTALSQYEREQLARIEAAPDAEESLRVRVMRAITEAEKAHGDFGFPCLCGWLAPFGEGWEAHIKAHQSAAKADAAIAVMRGES